MKIRTIWHSFAECAHNFLTHPFITLASITTMTLMLVLLGFFSLSSLNIRYIVEELSKQPPIEVYCKLSDTAEEIRQVQKSIEDFGGIYELKSISPEENLQNFIKSIGDDNDTFKYFDPRNIPHSFIVKLENPENALAFKNKMLAEPGVFMVDLNQEIMDLLSRANYWVNVVSIGILIFLAAVSFFVISNMVKISVFSRGNEIEIMKYIGATNAYIRFPYILEGAIIGIVGAALADIILYFSYKSLYVYLAQQTSTVDYINLRFDMPLAVIVVVITAGLGILVGVFSSALSVRRHIKV